MAFRHWLTSPRACTWASLGFIAVALVLAILRNVLVIKFPTALPLALSLMFFGTVWRQATLDGNASAKRVAPWLLGVIIVMIVPISVVGYSHDFGYHEHWQPYVICYSAAIATFVLCTTRLQITWRPLVWLGQISYSIYLLHPLIAAACYRLGFRSSIMPGGALVYAVTLAAIAVACSWLTYRFIEQPGIRTGRWLIQVLRAGPVGASGSTTPASH
jgi:peptidoglycan/LPS O-acetylase OafA/YrhL